jgi:guanylate kinase
MMPGQLFIVSAPSGAGKTSLVRELRKAEPAVELSVSYTTRAPRPGEVDGVDYHFVDATTFEAMLERGEFLESAQVHGNQYGTGLPWIEARMRAGHDILLEIDWQGAAQVRRLLPASIGIFILPPSVTELARRLTGRAQDAPDAIAGRLAVAREEMSHAPEFDYVIINDRFDDALKDLVAVVRASRVRSAVQLGRHPDLLT